MKTEVNPNQEFEAGRTGAGETTPRATPPTNAEVANAKNAQDVAAKEANEATAEWVRFRALKPNPGRNNPGDPSKYDPTVDEALQNDMMQKAAARNEALDKWRAADIANRQRPGRGGGFPPPRPAPNPPAGSPGCPPNCGNENKTLTDANKSVVGAVGVSNVLIGK
jgi:hypothetical protein